VIANEIAEESTRSINMPPDPHGTWISSARQREDVARLACRCPRCPSLTSERIGDHATTIAENGHLTTSAGATVRHHKIDAGLPAAQKQHNHDKGSDIWNWIEEYTVAANDGPGGSAMTPGETEKGEEGKKKAGPCGASMAPSRSRDFLLLPGLRRGEWSGFGWRNRRGKGDFGLLLHEGRAPVFSDGEGGACSSCSLARLAAVGVASGGGGARP